MRPEVGGEFDMSTCVNRKPRSQAGGRCGGWDTGKARYIQKSCDRQAQVTKVDAYGMVMLWKLQKASVKAR